MLRIRIRSDPYFFGTRIRIRIFLKGRIRIFFTDPDPTLQKRSSVQEILYKITYLLYVITCSCQVIQCVQTYCHCKGEVTMGIFMMFPRWSLLDHQKQINTHILEGRIRIRIRIFFKGRIRIRFYFRGRIRIRIRF